MKNIKYLTIEVIIALLFVMLSSKNVSADSFKNEFKLGILKHDLRVFGGGKKEDGTDINLEYIRKIDYKFAPYINIGGTFNTNGQTDLFYSSIDYRLMKNYYYGGVNFGIVYHTDRTDRCSVLPREALYIGYKVSRRYSVELFLDHISDADLCEPNDSMETGGIRLGLAF